MAGQFSYGFGRRGTRLPGRVITLVAMAIMLIVGVGLIIASQTVVRADAALSSYVQAHGVRRTGTIVSVQNIAHRSKQASGNGHTQQTTTTYTAQVATRLAAPVDGQQETTVSVPYQVTSAPGSPVTVLVDPQKPSYAELPGSPATDASDPLILLIAGIVVAVISLSVSTLVLRRRRAPMPSSFRTGSAQAWQRTDGGPWQEAGPVTPPWDA